MKYKVLLSIQTKYNFYWFVITENNDKLIVLATTRFAFFITLDEFINLKILNINILFKCNLSENSIMNIEKVKELPDGYSHIFSESHINEIKNSDSYKEIIDKYY